MEARELVENMGYKMTRRIGMLALLMATACVWVPTEVSDDIRINAVVSAAVVASWDDLTPEQRREAYWKGARHHQDLNWSINDEEVPSEFVGDYEVRSD